ncbi:helix-turn-helix domain-containing protein [Rhodococcus maanshanensis]|uniref:winged helix-turn-helix transcriptional regulator n=1 Tax=Rhodococcus maanshanensis TaxID=183556 RepID=UPI0022B5D669|nr:helix-turn-helix domain-containing protein [Rhodococcus maanshanensis]MCZ4556264.1 helix-turn-helix domain-containing protein [Rhodococcus maanshanensis]
MELLGQRWILRALWELEPGPLGFLELRRRMGSCSSSVLSERLQQLQNAGVLEKRTDKSYELTVAGMELGAALQHVWDWSERWSDDLRSTR